ncbi:MULTISPECIES: group III truncated hemoglobin [unclassified Robiginitalea]|uniref:group III truncated hemoglobin n=1 Tax=Robiginitalea TaxID=252306 RepID=UPI00234B06A2|nr:MULTISPECIES: group III truncated hemoglobin [unclassified Robiginitalea]MDC6355342.1 group III truncated hemoglobin [Robiginitalea sp. PM2]MDC6375443.1 group III truncated hemoglobin [Robiginitalea sp. SP8]
MERGDIANRKDVARLVRTFYGKIRQHPVLGPIFEQNITDWEAHFEVLTDFWESQLFPVKKYWGNPVTAHQQVDVQSGGTITMDHFGQWINLWTETLDELFEGDNAWIAKNRARKMSTMLFLKIYENRKR